MEREKSIDILKGIGILAVVIGHSSDIPPQLHHLIFSFHMPLFFIASGIFYRKETMAKTIMGGGKLIYYYIFAALVFVGLSMLIGKITNIKEGMEAVAFANARPINSVHFGLMPTIKILWFLPALFWCKTVYNLINNYTDFGYLSIFIYACVSYLALITVNNVNFPLGIQAGMTALVFYDAGVKIKNNSLKGCTVLVFLMLWFVSFMLTDLDMGGFIYHHYLLNLAGGVGGTICILYMIRKLLILKWNSVITTYIINFISFIGRYSLYVFIIHALLSPLITLITGYQGGHLYTLNMFICILMAFLSYIFLKRLHN